MQIATSPTREKFPLSYSKIIKKTISGSIGYSLLFLFSLIIFIPLFASLDPGQLPFGAGTFFGVIFFIVSLSVLITYFYQRWYFAVYYYELSTDYIVIKKGPITPKEITIPYERVQDVYVDQDIFDRIFGLYDVHLSSATFTSGMAAHIDGVEKAAAEGLRDELLAKVRSKTIKRNDEYHAASQ